MFEIEKIRKIDGLQFPYQLDLCHGQDFPRKGSPAIHRQEPIYIGEEMLPSLDLTFEINHLGVRAGSKSIMNDMNSQTFSGMK